MAANATSTAETRHATSTVAANQATATAQAAATTDAYAAALRTEQLRREQLATRRAELVQPLKAYGPWVLLIVVVVVLAVAFWRFAAVLVSRQRVVETGTGLVMVLGKKTQLPQNHWGPIMDVAQPQALPNPEQQNDVTRRAQTVQAIKAAQSGGRTRAAQQAARRVASSGGQGPPRPPLRLGRLQPVRRLQHAAQAGLVSPQLTTAIENDWRENVIEGHYREV